MKRVIITGPTGAIGMALIRKYTEMEAEVTAVCHRGSRRLSRIPVSDRVRVVECSLDEMKTLPDLLEGRYDVFIHLAWACTAGEGRNDTDAQTHKKSFYNDEFMDAVCRNMYLYECYISGMK